MDRSARTARFRAEASPVAEVERWFLRRGLPHFINDYRAGSDVWTRSVPVLAVAYLAGALNGLDLARWSAVKNLGAAAGVVALAVAVFAAANLIRRRPPFSMPSHIGPFELAVFVVGPALPSLLFRQWGDVVQTLVEGLSVLGVIYLATSYGLVPMLRWAAGRALLLVADLGSVIAKALPLMLLVVAFLFLAAEPWQVAAQLTGWAYPLTLGLFAGLGGTFLVGRLPMELRGLSTFDSWAEIDRLLVGSPGGALAPVAGEENQPQPVPLTRRQWLNVGLVTLVPQAVQITAVALGIGSFFVVFGFLAMGEAVTGSWVGEAPNVLVGVTVWGRRLVLTEELLRVSGLLGAFSGMYFTVYLATDATYRAEFRNDVVEEVREAFAARARYLDVTAAPPLPPRP
jgi:hypothetical protein